MHFRNQIAISPQHQRVYDWAGRHIIKVLLEGTFRYIPMDIQTYMYTRIYHIVNYKTLPQWSNQQIVVNTQTFGNIQMKAHRNNKAKTQILYIIHKICLYLSRCDRIPSVSSS